VGIGTRPAAGRVEHVPAPRGGRGGASCLPRQQPHLPVSSVIIKYEMRLAIITDCKLTNTTNDQYYFNYGRTKTKKL
jgi:hypothetical protein